VHRGTLLLELLSWRLDLFKFKKQQVALQFIFYCKELEIVNLLSLTTAFDAFTKTLKYWHKWLFSINTISRSKNIGPLSDEQSHKSSWGIPAYRFPFNISSSKFPDSQSVKTFNTNSFIGVIQSPAYIWQDSDIFSESAITALLPWCRSIIYQYFHNSKKTDTLTIGWI